MIDPNKCEFEEGWEIDSGEVVYYFTYPRDFNEVEFDPEETYGNVYCMTIALTVIDDHNGRLNYYLQMSPTVADDSGMSDVDWRDMYEGINYTDDMISSLLNATGDYHF